MNKPRKFIIEIHDDLDIISALVKCATVMKKGLISTTRGQKHHCHASIFSDSTLVSCTLNKSGSERFQISKTTP